MDTTTQGTLGMAPVGHACTQHTAHSTQHHASLCSSQAFFMTGYATCYQHNLQSSYALTNTQCCAAVVDQPLYYRAALCCAVCM